MKTRKTPVFAAALIGYALSIAPVSAQGCDKIFDWAMFCTKSQGWKASSVAEPAETVYTRPDAQELVLRKLERDNPYLPLGETPLQSLAFRERLLVNRTAAVQPVSLLEREDIMIAGFSGLRILYGDPREPWPNLYVATLIFDGKRGYVIRTAGHADLGTAALYRLHDETLSGITFMLGEAE